MAIYSLNASIISRAKGHSVISYCAHKGSLALLDEQTGKKQDSSQRKKNVYNDLSIPDNAPQWVIDLKKIHQSSIEDASSLLWNSVEEKEDQWNSQLSRVYRIALPIELNQLENIELVRDFIQSTFSSCEIISDWSIDFEKENPNVIIMTTTRYLENQGFGNKIRELGQLKFLYTVREAWEIFANKALEKKGLDIRIDRRSNKDRGIELKATKHLGKSVLEQEQRGVQTERMKEQKKIQMDNLHTIINKPMTIMDALTKDSKTFTSAKVVNAFFRFTLSYHEGRNNAKKEDTPSTTSLLMKDVKSWMENEVLPINEAKLIELLLQLNPNFDPSKFILALKQIKSLLYNKDNITPMGLLENGEKYFTICQNTKMIKNNELIENE